MGKMQFTNFHGKVQLLYRLGPPFRAFTSLRQAEWKPNYIYTKVVLSKYEHRTR